MAGKTVTADAQFGVARILRPFAGFVDVYQGQPASTPIMLTEVADPPGGTALDPFAQTRTPGYSSKLIRGVEVPIGSRVILWLPNIVAYDIGTSTIIRYQWTLCWRLRNTFDYRNARMPYHYPKQGAGIAETGADAGERVVIPCATQTLPYSESPEPTGALDNVVTNLRNEAVTTGATPLSNPLLPDGSDGYFQQGLGDPNVSPVFSLPLYQLHEVQAVGDELLIGLTRDATLLPDWDFGTPLINDWQVNLCLGGSGAAAPPRPDIGVYVMTGTAP
jgi:hypothetical protein